MIEHTVLGRAIRVGFVAAGLLLALGIPTAMILALVAGSSSGGGGIAAAGLDLALAACRLGLLLGGVATLAVLVAMCLPERFLRR